MVTRFAAIQLVIIEVMTSLTLRKALKNPGMQPQRAPATAAVRKASIHTSPAGIFDVSSDSATTMALIVPIRY